ncbi:eukaryotic translation initiation factor 2A-like [Saccoglossus kowalevskii]|uniref:Eukaryotic translation initiation factor 2A n=1 Tax=Saccoglossus kowalevskii TaxID=10224 RepID=A0ABM0LZL1_SACKO|nr:PREDICTED: eukaryotic translation initiation factor 2A-like [Saccoglossus kowalevskii]
MAEPCPLLAVRGSTGLSLFEGPPSLKEHSDFPKDISNKCKVCAYSSDGALFAWCNGQSVIIIEVASCSLVQRINRPKTIFLEFSPKNSILATWEPYVASKDIPGGNPNLQLWNVKSGDHIKGFVQKRQDTWCPQWSSDESLCARNVNNEIHFFEGNNFDTIAKKLHIQKVSDFQLSPGDMPCKVAAYVPGSKGAPSFVRIFKYPNLEGPGAALANKSFFKADRVTMLWNKRGRDLLVITTVDVDKTGASYYGEQTLHYLSTNGETCAVPLAKKGPIYSVDWNPNSSDFCVVYGFMPAKATLYNLKCDPVFDFGTGPRNTVYFNPQGNIICLAGFGNLRGNMEFWDRKQLNMVSEMQASDSTSFEWCPDGVHILTSTCAPRLRVGNGFKIWNYSGALLYETTIEANAELWEAKWQSFPVEVFQEKSTRSGGHSAIKVSKPEPKPAAYRPPGLRGQPQRKADGLHADDKELPQNMKTQTTNPEGLSKTALKKKKRKEAKVRALQQADHVDSRSQEQKDAIAMATYVTAPISSGDNNPAKETENRLRAVKKKLNQIRKMKEEQASGKKMDPNQLKKIACEAELQKELKKLQIS